jgi:hypothetical protein
MKEKTHNVYNGALYTTVFLRNKIGTILSRFVLFSVDAACFGPYIGPSSDIQ